MNSFHANVFQPVSSNQYSHRPRDKIHPHHFLRIITQRTSEFTREARGSNERCLPERSSSSREKMWRETEISQFNDTEVLSTSINEQLISIIHIWFCGIECVRRRLRHIRVAQGKYPHCKLLSFYSNPQRPSRVPRKVFLVPFVRDVAYMTAQISSFLIYHLPNLKRPLDTVIFVKLTNNKRSMMGTVRTQIII